MPSYHFNNKLVKCNNDSYVPEIVMTTMVARMDRTPTKRRLSRYINKNAITTEELESRLTEIAPFCNYEATLPNVELVEDNGPFGSTIRKGDAIWVDRHGKNFILESLLRYDTIMIKKVYTIPTRNRHRDYWINAIRYDFVKDRAELAAEASREEDATGTALLEVECRTYVDELIEIWQKDHLGDIMIFINNVESSNLNKKNKQIVLLHAYLVSLLFDITFQEFETEFAFILMYREADNDIDNQHLFFDNCINLMATLYTHKVLGGKLILTTDNLKRVYNCLNLIRHKKVAELQKTILALLSFSAENEQVFNNANAAASDISTMCQTLTKFFNNLDVDNLSSTVTNINSCAHVAKAKIDKLDVESLNSSVNSVEALVSMIRAHLQSYHERVDDILKKESVFGDVKYYLNLWAANTPAILFHLGHMFTHDFHVSQLVILGSLLGISTLISKRLLDYFFPATEQMDLLSLFNTLAKYLGNTTKIHRGVESGFALYKRLHDYLVKIGIFDEQDASFEAQCSVRYEALMKEHTKYSALMTERPCDIFNIELKDQFFASCKEVYALEASVLKLKDSSISIAVVRLAGLFRLLEATIKQTLLSANERATPVGICLLGVGGIGKSMLTAQLPVLLRQQYLKKYANDPKFKFLSFMKNHPPTSWSQNMSDDFMTGYSQQFVHVIDDAFQCSDQKDHPIFFKIVSATPYLTNQAGLNDKGRPYDSRLLVCSANKFPCASTTIKDPLALGRRFHIYKVEQGRPLKNASFDPNFSHLDFSYCPGLDYVQANGQITFSPSNLENLLDSILCNLQTNNATFEAMNSHFQSDDFTPSAPEEDEVFEAPSYNPFDGEEDDLNPFANLSDDDESLSAPSTDLDTTSDDDSDFDGYESCDDDDSFFQQFKGVFKRWRWDEMMKDCVNYDGWKRVNSKKIPGRYRELNNENVSNYFGFGDKNSGNRVNVFSRGKISYDLLSIVCDSCYVKGSNCTHTFGAHLRMSGTASVPFKDLSHATLQNKEIFELLARGRTRHVSKLGSFKECDGFYYVEDISHITGTNTTRVYCLDFTYGLLFTDVESLDHELSWGEYLKGLYDRVASSTIGTVISKLVKYLLVPFKHLFKFAEALWHKFEFLMTTILLKVYHLLQNVFSDTVALNLAQFVVTFLTTYILSLGTICAMYLYYKAVVWWKHDTLPCIECVSNIRLCQVTYGLNQVLHPKVCAECDHGYFKTVHTEDCIEAKALVNKASAVLCACGGDCKNVCFHSHGTITRQERFKLQNIIIQYCPDLFNVTYEWLKTTYGPMRLSYYLKIFEQITRFKVVTQNDGSVNTFALVARSREESGDGKILVRRNVTVSSTEALELDLSDKEGDVLESGDGKIIKNRNRNLLEYIHCSFRAPVNVEVESQVLSDDGELVEDIQGLWVGVEEEDLEKYYSLMGHAKPKDVVFESEEIQTDSGAIATMNTLKKLLIPLRQEGSSKSHPAMLYGTVFNKYVITPFHLSNGSSIVVGTYDDIEYKFEYMAGVPGREIAVYKVIGDRVFPSTLLRHLMTDAEMIDRLRQSSTAIQYAPKSDMTIPSTVKMQENLHLNIKTDNGIQEKVYDKLWTVSGLNTVTFTQGGDCGGPLVLLNTKSSKKYLGQHVIGSSGCSRSSIITKDILDKLINNEESDSSFTLRDQMFEGDLPDRYEETPDLLPIGDFDYLGFREYEKPDPQSSNIKEHPLKGLFPVKVGPAVFKAEHVEDPSKLLKTASGRPSILLTQTSKWGKKMVPTEEHTEFLREIVPELTTHFQHVLGDYNLGPVTKSVAINGCPVENIPPLNIKSSPGIPWNKKYSSKKQMLVDVGKDKMTGSIIYDIPASVDYVLDHKLELAKKNVRYFSIWKDCLKDETRPLDKVKIGKTRVFTCAPFESCLAFRVLFARFKHFWQMHRDRLFHSTGVSLPSSEWKLMYERMKTRGGYGIDADYGRFDGNLRQEFMLAARDIIRETILASQLDEDVDKDILRNQINTLFAECIWTVQQSGDVLYLSNHGNPSGNPLTTQVNCIVNLLYHIYSFNKATKGEGLKHFTDLTYFTSMGDDAILVFPRELGISFKDIQTIMEQDLEQEYTNAAKERDGDMIPISELSFLKRQFSPRNGLVYAPLEKDSIEQQFNFCMYNEDSLDILRVCVENALEEAVHWGKEYYEYLSGILVPAFNKHQKTIDCISDPYTPERYSSARAALYHKLIV